MADNNTAWPNASYEITPPPNETLKITVKGRDRWALEQLMYAGDTVCTPITQPARRWETYVFNLRRLGVPIETITEAHGGPFTHARYCLRAVVKSLQGSEVTS